MNPEAIVRAWKDPDHRGGDTRFDCPVGQIELEPEHGGAALPDTWLGATCGFFTLGCCYITMDCRAEVL